MQTGEHVHLIHQHACVEKVHNLQHHKQVKAECIVTGRSNRLGKFLEIILATSGHIERTSRTHS
jgi:hypothetical protein